MKLTVEKLTQIIREEVESVVEAFNYGPDGKPTPAQQRWRSRERNVGVAASEKYASSLAAKRAVRLTDDEKETISDLIDEFLANANDENSGWWPQTWVGGGKYYKGGEYFERTPEMNAKIRKQFDDVRASSGRDPFTVDHIKQDLKQTGTSVWYFEDGELKHPSLKAFIQEYLLKDINQALEVTGLEAEKKLKAYLSAL